MSWNCSGPRSSGRGRTNRGRGAPGGGHNWRGGRGGRGRGGRGAAHLETEKESTDDFYDEAGYEEYLRFKSMAEKKNFDTTSSYGNCTAGYADMGKGTPEHALHTFASTKKHVDWIVDSGALK